ncbi:MAG: hypothetical protein IH996_01090, partial [Proteobacteria bacterium]|nr:hypothetical protein [Pseudomonadota bacterium]
MTPSSRIKTLSKVAFFALGAALLLALLGTSDPALAKCVDGVNTKNGKPCGGGGEDPPSTPANPVIVYLDVNSWDQIMVMDADGGNQTRVYKDTQRDTLQFWDSLTWSPGGSFVAFRASGTVEVCEWNLGTYMSSLDSATGEWGPIESFACLNSKPREGMEFVPNSLADSRVQVIWPSEFFPNPDWIATGGVRLSAEFMPGDTSSIASVEIIAKPPGSDDNPDNNDIHRAVLSRPLAGGGNWIAWREGNFGGSVIEFEVIRIARFDASFLDPVTLVGNVDAVVSAPVVSLTAEEAGVNNFADLDFSSHSDTVIAYAANNNIYCLDFAGSGPLVPILLTGSAWEGVEISDPTWRPDGAGIVFGAVLSVNNISAEVVIGE